MTARIFRIDEPASQTLVSVLIPVYNAEKYLEESVRSILAQTYRDLEVVLLDDGSTDGSMAVAERLRRDDPRIVILPSAGRNRGVVATRNELLRNARGAYIAWNDSDDVSHPERIERQIRFLIKNPRFGAVGTGIMFADEKLTPQRSESYPADPKRQANDPMLCCATLMARRQAAGDAGWFREAFRAGGEDGDWIMKIADRHAVTNIPDILYTYRRHGDSLTHNARNWALSVRLGVIARWSARARRAGQPDPADALEAERLSEQLSAWRFIDNPALSQPEKMTALGRRLPGEAPAISILHGFVSDEAEIGRLAEAYGAQTLETFEILVAAKPGVAARLQAATDGAKCVIRIVPVAAQLCWRDLVTAARGRFVMTWTAAGELPTPWAMHNFVDLALSPEGSPSEGPLGPFRWRHVSAQDFLSGKAHRMILPAEGAEALAADGTGQAIARGVQILGRASIFSHILFRTKSVYRNLGARGVAHAVWRNLAGLALGKRVVRTRHEPAAAPLPPPGPSPDFAAAAAQAKLKVAVHECWGDFAESLYYLTPGSSGLSDGVMFAPAAEVPDPDFVLVLNTPSAQQVTVNAPPERLWFAIGEPPTATHRPLHRGQGEASTIVTCDMALPDGQDPGRRYIHAPAMTRTWHVKRAYDDLLAGVLPPKDKNLSWVTSNLRILDGHIYRMAFLDKLRARVPFDLYGRGFKPVADKWDAIAPYRYSIAFENMAAPLYFTEKVMDCFVCGTMPFYFGDPELEKRFPPGSFIRIDPEDPKVFDMIRDVSDSDLWRERHADLAEARDLVLNTYNMYRILAKHMLEAAAWPPSSPKTQVIVRQTVL